VFKAMKKAHHTTYLGTLDNDNDTMQKISSSNQIPIEESALKAYLSTPVNPRNGWFHGKKPND
jgi:hypothetical protein